MSIVPEENINEFLSVRQCDKQAANIQLDRLVAAPRRQNQRSGK